MKRLLILAVTSSAAAAAALTGGGGGAHAADRGQLRERSLDVPALRGPNDFASGVRSFRDPDLRISGRVRATIRVKKR